MTMRLAVLLAGGVAAIAAAAATQSDFAGAAGAEIGGTVPSVMSLSLSQTPSGDVRADVTSSHWPTRLDAQSGGRAREIAAWSVPVAGRHVSIPEIAASPARANGSRVVTVTLATDVP